MNMSDVVPTTPAPVEAAAAVPAQIVEDVPVEAAAAAAVPAQPVEDVPVPTQPVEDVPIEAQPVEDVPIEAQPVEEDVPVPAQPVEDVPVEAAAAAPALESKVASVVTAEPALAIAAAEEEPAVASVITAAATVAATVAAAAEAVLPEDAVSPMSRLHQELSSMNLFEGKTQPQIIGIRDKVEAGLQAFNAIDDACKIMHDAIVATVTTTATSVMKLRFNPEIGRLSDFVDHCKLLISINGANAEGAVKETLETLKGLTNDSRFHSSLYKLTVDPATIGYIEPQIGTQISLVLRIGEVFNVPVFTVYVLQNVFDNAKFDSAQATQPIASPLTHNLKTIATCSQVDLVLELLLHATQSDPYDKVNVLIYHIINESVVLKFRDDSNPNKVIAAERAQFFDLIIANNEHVKSLINKALLIAIIQNPSIMTPDGKRFSDMFPSGQYGQYFGDVVYRATTDPKNKGPIMLPNPNERAVQADEVGEAPGVDEPPRQRPSHPMTRTDIIVAALTAANDAMGRNANIVAAGGAAVSYYIADFVRGMQNGDFGGVIADSGLDVFALNALEKGCNNIPMNDIDCFVFGEVSRQFLMLFSLYMMILYANFYERPKQYGVEEAVRTQSTRVQFILSHQSSDNIELFMYGDHNEDANTRLISKTLKKNPKVQLVTQETKCFSQLSSTLCDGDLCTVDGYYTQPIDLVKKDIDDFLVLYESLYLDARKEKPDLRKLLTIQYAADVDNMVSMKTTMLDLICIFCNEDKALFIRIFMARKNPKDFARLRVFIEIYLLELLRANHATFLKYKAALIDEIKQLRTMMQALNVDYYLEQGNIAAVHAATADKLNVRRVAFLKLLRSIGRKIVLIPDPLNDKVPATFRKETGRNTIDFFKRNPQIKYPFNMDRHMVDLYGTYVSITTHDDTDQSFINGAYEMWLENVFKELRFVSKIITAFRVKMGKIIDKTQNPIYFEVGFSNMIVRSSSMLQLLTLLNQVKGSNAMFNPGVSRGDQRSFSGKLLGPLRQSILQTRRGTEPKATGVLKLYNTEAKALLPKFVRSVLPEVEPTLLSTIEHHHDYDDAVNEAIGRIMVEWNPDAPQGGGGGATRKRKRVCKRNAMTRRFNKCFNGKRRATRRKNKANNGTHKHKHTRRA